MAAPSAAHAESWAHSPGPVAIAPARAERPLSSRRGQCSRAAAVPAPPGPSCRSQLRRRLFVPFAVFSFCSFVFDHQARQGRLLAAGRRCGRRPAPLTARRRPAGADVSLRHGGGLGGDPAAGGRFPAGAVRRGSPQVSRAAPAPPPSPPAAPFPCGRGPARPHCRSLCRCWSSASLLGPQRTGGPGEATECVVTAKFESLGFTLLSA